MAGRPPLSVLDLSPVVAGSGVREALEATLDLARAAERAGYARYWLAEHHLNPGLAGSAPHVLAAHVAQATSRIRVGTAVTILGNYAPLQVAEAVATTAALHPGRIDVGLGRSGAPGSPPGSTAPGPTVAGPGLSGPAAPRASTTTRVVEGVVLPAPVVPDLSHPRWAAQSRLLRRVPGDGDRFADDVHAVLDLLAGPVPADADAPVSMQVVGAPAGLPGGPERASGPERTGGAGEQGAWGVQVWLHGSSPGASAHLAGSLGVRFGANYHVAPAKVVEAVAAYREAFTASHLPGRLTEPHVIVSADVVVADTDAAARDLAQGYGAWVWSIRKGAGAIPYPAPGRAPSMSSAQLADVTDRVDTQIVGSPASVVERLGALARLTGADELLITTITHDHAARVRSHELLAQAWAERTGLRAAS